MAFSHNFVIFFFDADGPEIEPLGESFVTQYNLSAHIPCGGEARGNPPPTFQWMYGSMEENVGRGLSQLSFPDRFSVDRDSGELMLSVAWHTDSGVYQCTASNSIGNASTFISVLVLGMQPV